MSSHRETLLRLLAGHDCSPSRGCCQGEGSTWLKVREMFFLCLRMAKMRLDTSSLALLA